MAKIGSFETIAPAQFNLLESPPVSDSPSFPDDLASNAETEPVILMLEGVLEAPRRCQIAASYIQAVVTSQRIFLASNLNSHREIRITPTGLSWTIGRSAECAIAVSDFSISRCHATLHCDGDRFYITDSGSKNGTWVNQHRLSPKTPTCLRDGDLLRLGKLDVEFFILSSQRLKRLADPNQAQDLEASLSVH